MIPFVNLVEQRNAYRHEFEKIEKEVLDSGCFIGGLQVENLEKELSEYLGKGQKSAKNVKTVACGSGTDALTIALMALDIKPGDQVIVPNFTFIAPAESVALLGGTPVFADIDPRTLQISPESVEKLVTKATKGVIAVNLFGQCAPYKELRRIADQHGLWIIEDSAQAFGTTQDGVQACTFGDISITSFYPTKPLGCYGDGGAIFTQSSSQAEKCRMLANHGSPGHYDHRLIGVNSRLDAIQAAILRVKLGHLDSELSVRQQNAEKYNRFFTEEWNLSPVQPQLLASGNTSTYAQYTLLAKDRNRFTELLKKAGIPYCIHYPATLSSQPCFEGFARLSASTPVAEQASTQAISLPVCAFTDVDEIIKRLRSL